MMCIILFFYLAIAGMGCGLILHPKIGITQPGKCLTNSYNYNIRDCQANLSLNITNPILYDGPDRSCIDNKYIQSCEALRTDPLLQLSAELFTQQFKAGTGLLFPYFFLVIFTLIAHLLSVGISDDYGDILDIPVRRHIYAYSNMASGFLLALFIFLSSYGCRFMFIERCNSIMVDLNEAAGFCRRLSRCGFTLASVYSTDWTTAYGYSSVMFVFGVIIVFIQFCHLPLVLLDHYYFGHTTHFEVRRLATLSMQGDELNQALEAASWQFISYYITGWKRVMQPENTNPAAPAPGAVYSPLATTDPTPEPTTDPTPEPTTEPASNPTIPPVPDIEQVTDHCNICKELLFTINGDKKCIELRCNHKFHQVCILNYAIDITNTSCPICSHTLK